MQNYLSVRGDHGFGLDQIAQAARNSSFKANDFARRRAAQNFNAAQCCQFEPEQGWIFRIGLGDNTSELSRGFD